MTLRKFSAICDPLNPAHLRLAYDRLLESNLCWLPGNMAEDLRRLGIPIDKRHRIGQPPPGESIDFVICGFFFLHIGMYFHDNILTTCADCNRPVQHRPHAPAGARLCPFCAADRASVQ